MNHLSNVLKAVIQKTIRHPETDEIIIRPDELITPEIAKKITDAGIEKCISVQHLHVILVMVYVKKCYGKTLCYR